MGLGLRKYNNVVYCSLAEQVQLQENPIKVGGSRTVWALKPPTFSSVHCLYIMLFHLYKSVQTVYILRRWAILEPKLIQLQKFISNPTKLQKIQNDLGYMPIPLFFQEKFTEKNFKKFHLPKIQF